MYSEENTRETESEKKNGITYLVLLIIAFLLISFIFLVSANITGAAIAAALGIGVSILK